MFHPLVVQKETPLSNGHQSALSCPHCKMGGHPVLERYVTVSIVYNVEDGYWHCLVCGFIGFGSSYELLQYRLVACMGGSPRVPGHKARTKRKLHEE